MNTFINGLSERYQCNLIACFGRARLVLLPDGRTELRNASEAERTEAKEWISLFMHEAILCTTAH